MATFATTAIADKSLPTVEGKQVEELIAEFFPNNTKTMTAIAKCESGLVHKVKGKLLPNKDGGTASGSFQVLMRIHKSEMIKMGLNPLNDDDYMTYVKHLYQTQGLSPWAESKKCWRRKVKT